MKKSMILAILALIFGVLAVVLCFIWYDWKLALILFIWQFGANLQQKHSEL